MGIPGPTELIIILVVVVLLFGSRKVPELMKGVAQGLRSWKDTMKEAEDATKRS